MTPSAFSRLATNLVSGLVSTAAQSFAGVKTFLAAPIAAAGVQTAKIFNTNGGGGTDVAVQAGTSLADGSVNANATLLQIATGIGATAVQSFAFFKGGVMTGTSGALRLNGSNGAQLDFNAGSQGIQAGSTNVNLFTNGAQRLRFTQGGLLGISGTSDIATASPVTINKTSGRVAIQAGASSVVVNNNQAAVGNSVFVSMESLDATATRVSGKVTSAGVITITANAAASAQLVVNWLLNEQI